MYLYCSILYEKLYIFAVKELRKVDKLNKINNTINFFLSFKNEFIKITINNKLILQNIMIDFYLDILQLCGFVYNVKFKKFLLCLGGLVHTRNVIVRNNIVLLLKYIKNGALFCK